MKTENIIAEIQAATLNELKKMVSLINDANSNNLVPSVSLLVVSLVSTLSDLLESKHEGASTHFFKEVETGLQLGIVDKIKDLQTKNGGASYSLSEISPNDFENGMNYLGQALSETLFSTIHELPETMRNQEMFLRGIEALLANLLHSKFRALGDVHGILDSLCEHVHMNLKALGNKVVPIQTK